MMAPENRPLLIGDSVCKLTLPEPALSPKIVTLSGSPPNAAICKEIPGSQKKKYGVADYRHFINGNTQLYLQT